jgi:hypothetical protein
MMKLNLLLLSAAALFNAATADEALDNGRAVDLGSAANYAILANSGISSVPASDITGDIAVSPSVTSTAITGFTLMKDVDDDFSTSTQLTGSRAFASDYSDDVMTALTTAVGDMQNAYIDAKGRDADESVDGGQTYTNLGGGDISGETLQPGVYNFTSSISINADITLKGTADTADVFIIQTTGSLLQAANTEVILDNVSPDNVFWQVTGTVDVGKSAVLNGILLVKTKAVFQTSSTLIGRVLAQTACTLDKTTIVQA